MLDDALVQECAEAYDKAVSVSILVVLDDALVLTQEEYYNLLVGSQSLLCWTML